MMKALQNLQAKGDLLVTEIDKQKKTLDTLDSKIGASSQNLTKINNLLTSKQSVLSKIDSKILKSQKEIIESWKKRNPGVKMRRAILSDNFEDIFNEYCMLGVEFLK